MEPLQVLIDYQERHGLVGLQMAELLGCHPVEYSYWRNGKRPVPPEKVHPFCEAMGGEVEPWQLRPDIFPAPAKEKAS